MRVRAKEELNSLSTLLEILLRLLKPKTEYIKSATGMFITFSVCIYFFINCYR